MSQLRRDVLPSSPAPLLVPEVVKHRGRNQSSPKDPGDIDESIDLSRDREPSGVSKLAEIPTPPLAAGEALVRVLLSPINPSDLHMVRGRYGYQPKLPASPGAEGVGIVEAVGPA